MTCIVGVEYDGGVLIGGDSAATAGWRQTTRADEKVFTNGPYVIGLSGSPRAAQLLRYRFNLHAPDTWDVDRFMATTFIDAVRETLKAGGYADTTNTTHDAFQSYFLVGVRGRLYAIYSDFQFSRSTAGHLAVGCGDEIALGSLHTTGPDGLGLDPRTRVQYALEAAAAISAGCGGPFTVIDQPIERETP